MRVANIVAMNLTKQIRFTNIFAKVPMAPPDPVLGIQVAYNNDSDPRKVNLGVGAYRDDDLKPVVFKVVRKIE
jgi:aspartate/tyrosine/aromatic aminotransferase